MPTAVAEAPTDWTARHDQIVLQFVAGELTDKQVAKAIKDAGLDREYVESNIAWAKRRQEQIDILRDVQSAAIDAELIEARAAADAELKAAQEKYARVVDELGKRSTSGAHDRGKKGLARQLLVSDAPGWIAPKLEELREELRSAEQRRQYAAGTVQDCDRKCAALEHHLNQLKAFRDDKNEGLIEARHVKKRELEQAQQRLERAREALAAVTDKPVELADLVRAIEFEQLAPWPAPDYATWLARNGSP